MSNLFHVYMDMYDLLHIYIFMCIYIYIYIHIYIFTDI